MSANNIGKGVITFRYLCLSLGLIMFIFINQVNSQTNKGVVKKMDLLDSLYKRIDYFSTLQEMDSTIYFGEMFIKQYNDFSNIKYNLKYCEILTACAIAYNNKFDFIKGELYSEKCFLTYNKFQFKDSINYLTNLVILSISKYRLGKNDEALIHSKNGINILEKNLEPDSSITALNIIFYTILGSVYSDLNDLFNAEYYFKRAKQSIDKLPEETRMSDSFKQVIDLFRNNYSLYLMNIGNYKKATEMFLELEMDLKNNGNIFINKYQLITLYNNLFQVYSNQSDYSNAENYIQKIDKLYFLSPELMISTKYKVYLRNKLQFYKARGLDTKSYNLSEELNRYYDAFENQDTTMDKVYYLISLADDYIYSSEQIYLSELWLLYANNILKKWPQYEYSTAYNHILNSLGTIYLELGEFNESKGKLNEAYSNLLKINSIETIEGVDVISTLAMVYLKQNNLIMADSLENISLNISQKLLRDSSLSGKIDFGGDIEIFYKMNNISKTVELIKEQLKLNKYSIENYLITLIERDKNQYLKNMSYDLFSYLNLYLTFNTEEPYLSEDLFNYEIMTKGIILGQESNLRNKITHENNKEALSVFDMWQLKKQSLSNILSDSTKEFTLTKTKLIELEIDSLEKELKIISKSFSELKSKKDVNFKYLKENLSNDEAIIEIIEVPYWNYEDGWKDSSIYVCFVITNEMKEYPQMILIKDGKDLDGKYFDDYKKKLGIDNYQTRDEDYISYNVFWAPFDSIIKEKKTVYLSPDGIYNKINPLTLITPKGKYLSEEKNIRLITSTRDIQEFKKVKPSRIIDDVVLVGDPQFNLLPGKPNNLVTNSAANNVSVSDVNQFTQRSFDNANISELPATRKEIESISRILTGNNWRVKSLTGENALEESVKMVTSPRVLHIATHGYFSKDIDTDTTKSFLGMDSKKAFENPLLRSGLLLAGAKNTIEGRYNPISGLDNGILTAYEVSNMNLDSTELVVLSACETGLGDVKNGEGVYGLQRAFKIAGAKSLIMSLWKVDDNATQILMTSFYKKWLSGESKREAFKEAQTELRSNPLYEHPYYWGGFVYMGE